MPWEHLSQSLGTSFPRRGNKYPSLWEDFCRKGKQGDPRGKHGVAYQVLPEVLFSLTAGRLSVPKALTLPHEQYTYI